MDNNKIINEVPFVNINNDEESHMQGFLESGISNNNENTNSSESNDEEDDDDDNFTDTDTIKVNGNCDKIKNSRKLNISFYFFKY